MYQQPAMVWNEVARLGKPMATRTYQLLFQMEQQQLDLALDSLAARVEAAGADATVLRAWMEVMPLLMENAAISRAAMKEPDLRQALPEVTSVREAIYLATREHNLTRDQVTSLHRLVRMPLPSPSA